MVKNDGVTKQYTDDSNLNMRQYLHQNFSINKLGWTKWVYQNYEFKSNAKVLELGCGNGMIWKDNLELIPDDIDITLTDFSEGMLATAKSNLTALHNINYRVVNIEEINFPDQTFDVVIANHMLYHVPDRDKALSEVRRVLKPGGTFYATTMGNRNMAEYRELLMEFDGRINYSDVGMSKRFGLENGKEQIIKYFSDVTRRDYEDGLKITNVEALYNYTISLEGIYNVADIVRDRKEQFIDYLNDKMRQEGAIYISKLAGIFIAK